MGRPGLVHPVPGKTNWDPGMWVGPVLWGLNITGGQGNIPLSLRPQLTLPPPPFLFFQPYAGTPGICLSLAASPGLSPLPTRPAS